MLKGWKVVGYKNKCYRYGYLMKKALKYMINGWDDLLKYNNDGKYAIDNLVGRAIRSFTVGRKNKLHFSSEDGVKVSTTFLTLVEPAKVYL